MEAKPPLPAAAVLATDSGPEPAPEDGKPEEKPNNPFLTPEQRAEAHSRRMFNNNDIMDSQEYSRASRCSISMNADIAQGAVLAGGSASKGISKQRQRRILEGEEKLLRKSTGAQEESK